MKLKQDNAARKQMMEQILNHPVSGEVYILTPGRLWKALVLNNFNKVKRRELTIDELVIYLETKCGVKYAQKHHLVKYPIRECLLFISKVTKQAIDLEQESRGIDNNEII